MLKLTEQAGLSDLNWTAIMKRGRALDPKKQEILNRYKDSGKHKQPRIFLTIWVVKIGIGQ